MEVAGPSKDVITKTQVIDGDDADKMINVEATEKVKKSGIYENFRKWLVDNGTLISPKVSPASFSMPMSCRLTGRLRLAVLGMSVLLQAMKFARRA